MVVALQTAELSLLKGVWELCLPISSPVELSIRGTGDLVDSWRSKLGLQGRFAEEKRFDMLDISLVGCEQYLKTKIDGLYSLLPKCGTACGALYARRCDDEILYFFLESGRCTVAESDAFVFAKTKHRTSYGEYRDVILKLDPTEGFRPIHNQGDQSSWRVRALTPGRWVSTTGVSLADFRECNRSSPVKINAPSSNCDPCVPNASLSWMKCPEILSCQVPMTFEDPLYLQCKAFDSPLELNLQKSRQIFQDLAFVTSRFSIPTVFARSDDDCWLLLDSAECPMENNEEVPCKKCAPDKPRVRWTLIKKAKTQRFIPMEDGKEAAAYEVALKNRPSPWVIRFTAGEDSQSYSGLANLMLRVGCNAASLVQRALGLFPKSSPPRRLLIETAQRVSEVPLTSLFDWRIVNHEEKSSGHFPKLQFQSNKEDQQALQPPNFKRYGLRKEQLRSLHWMLSQEASSDPFWEEEVAEAILPNLSWRAEGRVRRPVLVRGGIIADEVSANYAYAK
jgi:hypothetical protein